MALADQLTSSEWRNWLDDPAKLEMAQKFRTSTRYSHWFLEKRGPMQKNQDPLYSSRKQSIYRHWKVESGQPHWVDWESTSEFDTNCDAAAVDMTGKLQACVKELHSLEAVQLPAELIAEVLTQVVPPVVAMQ